MPLTATTLGQALLHIYTFGPQATLYFPNVTRYEAGTPCIVAVPASDTCTEEASLHQQCLNAGFEH
jgi:hypothetical protein